jgi:polysaccharide pyruvyl transferase WcaK-like protein
VTRIFIGNPYFGTANYGDDLTLDGFLSAAEGADVELYACSASNIEALSAKFPGVSWLPESERVVALSEADIWLGLGDTPFQLDSGSWCFDFNELELQRCAALGKPMYHLGIGCESVAAASDPRTAALLSAASFAWMRDELSSDLVRPFADPARLGSGADLAHLAFEGDARFPLPERDVLGLLLAFEKREQIDIDELAAFISRRAPGSTRWLAQDTRALPYLERWLLAEFPVEVRSRLSTMEFDHYTTSVADYLRMFGSPEVAITSRYHATLIAAWQGSRTFVIARSDKLRGIALEFGLPCAGAVLSQATLASAVTSAVAVPRERLRAARARANAMCEEFFSALSTPSRSSARAQPAAAVPRVAASDALPFEKLRATIEAQIPGALPAGAVATLRCVVTNRSDAVYASAPPHPIELCYRWFDESGGPIGAGTWIHTALPIPLGPGNRLEIPARVDVPAVPGTYDLALSLLQEGIAWFDDLDAASGVRRSVTVAARPEG